MIFGGGANPSVFGKDFKDYLRFSLRMSFWPSSLVRLAEWALKLEPSLFRGSILSKKVRGRIGFRNWIQPLWFNPFPARKCVGFVGVMPSVGGVCRSWSLSSFCRL